MQKILIAIPTHSQSVSSHTVRSIFDIQQALLQRGDSVSLEFFFGALIMEVRNRISSYFLTGDFDAVLMIDSDQGVPAKTILRLIDSKKPLTGCFYPKRQFDWSRLRDEDQGDPVPTMLYKASEYVGTIEYGGADGKSFDVHGGLAKAINLGTGVMLIRREVFETMMERYPQLKGEGYPPIPKAGPRYENNWGFFNLLVPGESEKRHYGEDYAFCYRWRTGCGGEIWGDVMSNVVHVGQHVFHGNMLDFLRARHGAKSNERKTDEGKPEPVTAPVAAIARQPEAVAAPAREVRVVRRAKA